MPFLFVYSLCLVHFSATLLFIQLLNKFLTYNGNRYEKSLSPKMLQPNRVNQNSQKYEFYVRHGKDSQGNLDRHQKSLYLQVPGSLF